MARSRSAWREILHWVVGAVALAVMLRTWLLLGLVAPVTVAGSSMAPTLRGPHIEATCPRCDTRFAAGLDQLPRHGVARCPGCGRRETDLSTAVPARADRLLVDRTAYWWRRPQRFHVVAFACPENARVYCVKRILGLPGETIRLAEGDVVVDGQRVRKSLIEQRAVRQLVHRERGEARRWRPDGGVAGWQWREGAWQLAGDVDLQVAWLRYEHVPGESITDAAAWNQRVARQENIVADLMITSNVALDAAGELLVEFSHDACRVTCSIALQQRTIQLHVDDQLVRAAPLGVGSTEGAFEWTVSLFDSQVLVATDERVLLRYRLPDEEKHEAVDTRPWRLAIGGRGGGARLAELSVWRDVYYEVRDEDRAVLRRRGSWADGATPVWRLGAGQYFVMGDNQAVSDDSRSWHEGPAVDDKFLLGKVLGVR